MTMQTERNDSIVEARRQGATFREVAERFGITPQRAQQIVRACDPDLETQKNWRRNSARRVHSQRRWEVTTMRQANPDMTLAVIAQRTGSSERFVRDTLIEQGLLEPAQRWDQQRVVEAMLRWRRERGEWPRSHEWRCSGAWWPCTATVVSRFGWSNCLNEAKSQHA